MRVAAWSKSIVAGHRNQRQRGHHHLFGESPETGEGDDPIAGFDAGHSGSGGDDLAGDLAPGDEGHRRLDLVATLADQPIDEVDPGGSNFDQDLALNRDRRVLFLEDQCLEGPELVADDGAHGQKIPPSPDRGVGSAPQRAKAVDDPGERRFEGVDVRVGGRPPDRDPKRSFAVHSHGLEDR